MAKMTPLQQVKELFGSKEKLVDTLMGLVERGEETKDELKARLLKAPNSKLLRLHESLKEIKESFGGKEQLVDAILELLGRAKDGDYRAKLMAFSPNRLVDLYRSTKRKANAA